MEIFKAVISMLDLICTVFLLIYIYIALLEKENNKLKQQNKELEEKYGKRK